MVTCVRLWALRGMGPVSPVHSGLSVDCHPASIWGRPVYTIIAMPVQMMTWQRGRRQTNTITNYYYAMERDVCRHI